MQNKADQKDKSHFNFINNPDGDKIINPTFHYPRILSPSIPVFYHSNCERSELRSIISNSVIFTATKAKIFRVRPHLLTGVGFYFIQQSLYPCYGGLIIGPIRRGKRQLSQFHCSRISPPGKGAARRSKKPIGSQTVIARNQIRFGRFLKRTRHFRISFCLPQ